MTLNDVAIGGAPNDIALLDLDDALSELAKIDERKTKVVELRYFGGLSVEEVAEVLNISPETAKRDWRMAKAWLFTTLKPKAASG